MNQPFPVRDGDSEAARRSRRREAFSRIYFSSGPQPAQPAQAETFSPPKQPVLVLCWNGAGARGGLFLNGTLRCLEARGRVAVRAEACSKRGWDFGQQAEALDTDRVPKCRGRGIATDYCFFPYRVGGAIPSGQLVLRADTFFVLLDGEPASVVSAYALFKQLSQVQPNPRALRPVVIPVAETDDTWSRVAAHRFAEAAARFLQWKLSIWLGGTPGRVAARLERHRHPPRVAGAPSLGGGFAPVLPPLGSG